jgi:O-antigen/teichoic acid export membrane protein
VTPSDASAQTAAAAAASRRSLVSSLLRGTALYSVALLVQRAIGFLLLPINTTYLDPADYGVLELLEQVGLVFSVITGVNLSAGLGYFYFKAGSAAERVQVTGTALIGSAGIGLVAALIGCALAGPTSLAVFGNRGYAGYLQVVFATLPAIVALEAGLAWLRVTDQPKKYAGISFLRAGLTVAGTVIFVAVLRLKVAGVLSTSVIAIAITCLATLFFYLRRHALSFRTDLCWSMLRYAVPLGLSNVAMVFIHFGDRFFLSRYVTLAEVGLYAVAYKISMLLGLVYNSFHTYWNAQVYGIAAREDAPLVMGRIFTYMMAVISWCALAIVVGSRPLLRIATTPAFHAAALLIPLITAAYHIRTIGDFFRCLFLAGNRPEWDAICNWIGAGVCLAGYAVLIPLYGTWGAATATLITFVVLAVISVWWSRRLARVEFDGKRLFQLSALTLILAALGLAIRFSSLALDAAWAVVLTAAFPVILLLTGFATPAEWEFGVAVWHKLRARVLARTGN